MHRAAHNLSTIDSIIYPLSELLELGKCVDSKNKQVANDALNAMNKAALIKVQEPRAIFEETAKKVAENALPLTQLQKDVNACTSLLSETVLKAFQQHSEALVTSVAKIRQQLTAVKSYEASVNPRDGTGKMMTVQNDLVDQKTVNLAQNLIKRIVPALKANSAAAGADAARKSSRDLGDDDRADVSKKTRH